MKFFRALRILFNRLRYTGTFRAPRRLTIQELEALATLIEQSKTKP
jgi:hypothetical protein